MPYHWLAVKEPSLAVDRQWVKPGEPLLESASRWLIKHAQSAARHADSAADSQRFCDLSKWLCVVRGGRAGRLLLHEIVSAANTNTLSVIPPTIVTQGRMVERLLDPGCPVANQVERTLAWMQALQAMPADEIAPLLPEMPGREDASTWHRVARTIDSLHEELAGAGVAMLDAADVAERMEQVSEGARWRVLAALQTNFRSVLRECGLVDPHESRWTAAKAGCAPGGASLAGIALVGVVELNGIQRAALRAAGVSITAFVRTEDSTRDGFDELGCVKTGYWTDREIELSDADVIVADRPADQAQAVMHTLADFGGQFAADEIVIGLGDETLRADVERAAMWADVAVHPAQGDPIKRLPAARLLAVIAEYLEDPRFGQFASLLRHPDVGRWLRTALPDKHGGSADWLTLLDRYFADHLQQRFAGNYLGKPERAAALREIHQAVQSLLVAFTPGTKPLTHWLPAITDLLAAIYGKAIFEEEGTHTFSAARELAAAIAGMSTLPSSLDPQLTAPAAMRLLLRECGDSVVPVLPKPNAIEMLGWLELSAEPARAFIITGVNEGKIPSTTTADPFLPDSMRARLGLACNATRYARDACLLSTMLASGNTIKLITARRSADAEPLMPSRLLLACSEHDLPKWVRKLCSEPPTAGLPIGAPQPGAQSQFLVPELPATAEVTHLAVTDFKRYIECPYRFALERLVGLDVVTDRVMELDGGKFGSLAHDVLCTFGESALMRDETDADTIREFLLDHLSDTVQRNFGSAPLPAVQVQAAQLAHRLRGFATFQAVSRQEGWRIEHCEYRLDDASVLEVPGAEPMPIHGKIDRIDRNERTGAWRIIDYKTSDGGGSPIEAHHGSKKLASDDELEWTDLQLPLYRYLAARSELRIDGQVELGFVVLPRQSDGVKWMHAPWSEAQLQSAVRRAQAIVTEIRAGRFPRNLAYISSFDPFARICQSMVLESAEDLLEDAEVSP